MNILNSTSFTDFFSDGLDSLIIDPAHPCHTVFKCPDDTLHHNFHLEKKNGVIIYDNVQYGSLHRHKKNSKKKNQ